MSLRRASQAAGIALAVAAIGAGVALGQADSGGGSLDPVAAKLQDDFQHLAQDCPDLVTPACEQAEEEILAYGVAHLEGDQVSDPAVLTKVQAVMDVYQEALSESPLSGAGKGK